MNRNSYAIYLMVPFLLTLNYPEFKKKTLFGVTPIFDAEYVINGHTYT